jgi:hypothetical protein
MPNWILSVNRVILPKQRKNSPPVLPVNCMTTCSASGNRPETWDEFISMDTTTCASRNECNNLGANLEVGENLNPNRGPSRVSVNVAQGPLKHPTSFKRLAAYYRKLWYSLTFCYPYNVVFCHYIIFVSFNHSFFYKSKLRAKTNIFSLY